jgi:elongator complex protein 3
MGIITNKTKIEEAEKAIFKLIDAFKNNNDLNVLKRKLAKEFGFSFFSNVELIKAYHNFCINKRFKPDLRIINFLKKRRIRSLSGVAVISVLTKPYSCPARCIFCPTEKGMPKSYLSNEPVVMRGILNSFNPYKQVKNRLESLNLTGHPTDKIQLIILGGTWSFLPLDYQKWFIKKCFDACNDKISKNLSLAQKINEKAKHRIIGITVETRPDFVNKEEIINLRKLGITAVEIGVQSIYDDVLKLNVRGHDINSVIQATKLLKDAGFKVCYHLMLNLFGSSIDLDKKMFKEIFRNSDFQPDFLKVYPCAIVREAELYRFWQEGKYIPYTEEELKNLIKEIKKEIPYYCRIQRLIRDIPSPSIVTGPAKISNLRQIVEEEIKKEGWRCKCIRCREVKDNYNPKERLYLFREDYSASGGKEVFLSYENKDRNKLYCLLRLRIPSNIFENKKHFINVLNDSAIIREVHTYGKVHPLNEEKFISSPQHRGLGKKLIKKAEEIARKEFGIKKMAVISGVGVRDYYRKLGYMLKDNYMVKNLTN